MKVRPLHIAVSLFLAASLMFAQVGLGYFHDKHDAHERINPTQKDQTQLHKHGEHCDVCSIDLFINLYIDDVAVQFTDHQVIVTSGIYQDRIQSLPVLFLKGRAPPVSRKS